MPDIEVDQLDDETRREAEQAIRGRYEDLRKRFRRKPEPQETIIAALAWAEQVLIDVEQNTAEPQGILRRRHWTDPVPARRKLVGPGEPSTPSDPRQHYADEIRIAQAVIAACRVLGDRFGPLDVWKRTQRDKLDRMIMDLLVKQTVRGEAANDSDVARQLATLDHPVKLSHTAVRDRKIERCARIMAALGVATSRSSSESY